MGKKNIHVKLVARRTYANNGGYESTYKNLMINAQTKVICQGFTGKQVRRKTKKKKKV